MGASMDVVSIICSLVVIGLLICQNPPPRLRQPSTACPTGAGIRMDDGERKGSRTHCKYFHCQKYNFSLCSKLQCPACIMNHDSAKIMSWQQQPLLDLLVLE